MARICVIRQFYYPLDIRVRREVEALASSGHEVDVICLARKGEPRFERHGLVTIRRLPLEHRRGNRLRYLMEYGWFLVMAGALAGALHVKRRYQLVQVHSLPDVLVFSALVPRLLGARVLLDLHECMPEFFATKFKVGLDHPAIRLTGWLEQASIRFAHAALTCTEQMRGAFVARGAQSEKISVILNSADESIFRLGAYPARPRDVEGELVLICHGSVEERYGIDTVIRAIRLLADEMPALRLEVYGEGSYLEALRALARDLGVDDRVRFSNGFVPMEDLLQAIADADVGVVAMKRDAFRDLTQCNKMYEYITMRKPVIVSRTKSVEQYFDDRCFLFFDSDDPHDLARCIRAAHASVDLRARLVDRAAAVNEAYRWERQRRTYLQTVERVLGGSESSAGSERRDVVPLPAFPDAGA